VAGSPWKCRTFLLGALVACGWSAAASVASELPRLHDANGDTGLVAFQTGIYTLAVVSSRGYSAELGFSGQLGGVYSGVNGFYRDPECVDGPYRPATQVIPGVVTIFSSPIVHYVPSDAESVFLSAGEQVYFVSQASCVPAQISVLGAYFRLERNNFAVTGIADSYTPPLRLLPPATAGATCVFDDGFECPSEP